MWNLITGGVRSMVQKRGVSMVQPSDFHRFIFGKEASRLYNEILNKIFKSY